MKPANPPKVLEKLFSWFCHRLHMEGLEGDLYELFERRVIDQGPFKAKLLYTYNIFTLLRPSVAKPFFKNSKTYQMDILMHYLKTSFRFAKRKSGFSLINLFGLTIGLTSVILISIFVQDELNYDTHISDRNSKYRVYIERMDLDDVFHSKVSMVPPVFATHIRENFPQVLKAGRVFFDYGGTIFTIDDKIFSETNGVYAELSAMEILDIKILEGDLSKLSEPNTLLLSETTFKKFFGEVPFSFQNVQLTRSSMQVVGVYEDQPKQSHLKPDYIFSFNLLLARVPQERMQSWVWQQFFTYLQLEEGANSEILFKEIDSYIASQSRGQTEKISFYYNPKFQLIEDIHLHSKNFQYDIAEVGDYQSVIFLLLSACIILLIASFNYINLTVAQTLSRTKGVSIRKFIGAQKKQLFTQHILESVLYCLIACIISLALVTFLMPFFNDFTGKSFYVTDFLSLEIIGIGFGMVLLLGFLFGIYPTLLITRTNPLRVLQGTKGENVFARWYNGINLKSTLVAIQYILCISLIITSLIIKKQYDFLQNNDMGFNKDNLMVIPLTRSLGNDLEATKASFSGHSNVTEVSYSYGIPGGIVAGDGVTIPRMGTNEIGTRLFIVAPNYIQTMGMKMLAGRDFSEDMVTDRAEAFIINETAVGDFGFNSVEEALGESITWNMWTDNDSIKRGKIIGVVDDFNFQSLHSPIESAVLIIEPDFFSFMILRFGSGDFKKTMTFVENSYREFESTRPFDFEMVDQTFDKFYVSEQRLSGLFSIYTFLAILAAIIGLLGLVSFSVASKAKEISIRKVLGASHKAIVSLLVSAYFKLVVVSIIIAIPIANYASKSWLSNFAFRIEVGAWIYLEVGLLILLLTAMTVAYHAAKGVRANPAERLRME